MYVYQFHQPGLEVRAGIEPTYDVLQAPAFAGRPTDHLVKWKGFEPSCATHGSFTDCSRKPYRAPQQIGGFNWI